MVDLKTLDEETLYGIWSDCCDNRWPEVVGQKPDRFDELFDERWNHPFAGRVKQDYLHPIGAAARSLLSEEFLQAKSEAEHEEWKEREYSRRDEAEKVIFLCYGVFGEPKRREKRAIREYCSKYPG